MRGVAVATLFLLVMVMAVSFQNTDATFWRYRLRFCHRWHYLKTLLGLCRRSKYMCMRDLKECEEDKAELEEDLSSCDSNLTSCQSDLEMAKENLTMCEEQLMEAQDNLTECQTSLANCTDTLDAINSICNESTCGTHGDCAIGPEGQPVCDCDPGYCGVPCEPSTATTGTTCSATMPCPISGAVCVGTQCVCQCGYTYVPDLFFDDASQTRDTCVRDCPSGYGGTFVRFPNRMIGNDDGKFIFGINTLAECESRCVSETDFVCRSYEYRSTTNTCTLNLAGKDDPIRFIPSPQKDFGQRVCL